MGRVDIDQIPLGALGQQMPAAGGERRTLCTVTATSPGQGTVRNQLRGIQRLRVARGGSRSDVRSLRAGGHGGILHGHRGQLCRISRRRWRPSRGGCRRSALRAGDRVSATVSYLGVFALRSGSSTYRVSRYRLAFTDLTEHRSFTVSDSIDCLRHPCDRSTAEVTAGLPRSPATRRSPTTASRPFPGWRSQMRTGVMTRSHPTGAGGCPSSPSFMARATIRRRLHRGSLAPAPALRFDGAPFRRPSPSQARRSNTALSRRRLAAMALRIASSTGRVYSRR